MAQGDIGKPPQGGFSFAGMTRTAAQIDATGCAGSAAHGYFPQSSASRSIAAVRAKTKQQFGRALS
jgi:hypothetical protein